MGFLGGVEGFILESLEKKMATFDNLSGVDVVALLREIISGEREITKRSSVNWDTAQVGIWFRAGKFALQVGVESGELVYIYEASLEKEGKLHRGVWEQWGEENEVPEVLLSPEEFKKLGSILQNAPQQEP